MRRKGSKLVLISAGAALAWFLDPVSGRDRRQKVADQLSGLTGGAVPGGDPTGGAAPPAVAQVQPFPTATSSDAALAQAVEAASGGEKVLGSPDEPDGPGDPDQGRAALRTSW